MSSVDAASSPAEAWYPGSPYDPDDSVPGLTTPLPFFLTDPARSIATFGCLAAAWPWLSTAPRAHGQPVLALPGFGAGDISTLPLRRYLKRLGYNVSGWGFGVNVGPTRRVLKGLLPLVEQLADQFGQPVSIVGWSLGGVFARAVARQTPDAVRQVITMGSPYALNHPRQARSVRLYSRFTRFHALPHEMPEHESVLPPLPVPSTSIYSRLDGIVDWRACVEPADDTHENISVWSSHLGYGHDPAVLWAVADRLGQREGTWEQFRPPLVARALYPTPFG